MVKKILTTKELLETILEERGITQRDLAAILKVSGAYVSEILSSQKKAQGRLLEFAEALGVDLFDRQDVPVRRDRPIPVISWVSAGEFREASDAHPAGVSGEGEPVFSVKKLGQNAFALRIVGDSMAPRFMPGDIIIVDPAIRCDNGCPAVVWINGEVSFKCFKETATEVILSALNDKYPDIVISKASSVDFRVIGKVVDMIPKL